jgi:glycerol-3-phosphate acyltransferase PlsY
MDMQILLLAALVGYLCGSISFARIIARAVAPEADISKITEPIPHSAEMFESDSVSATAVRVHVGTRYGCLTALLDMAKVALPTLAFKLWMPEIPYYLMVAAMGIVGHDWPIYHRFKGGRGESPIVGGVLVIDWLGLVVTSVAGAVLGLAIGSMLVLRWAGLVLLIPWMWWRFGAWPYPAYMLFVNVIYWSSMLPELRQYFKLKDAEAPTEEELGGFLAMGESLGRFMDRYSLPALWTKLRGRTSRMT